MPSRATSSPPGLSPEDQTLVYLFYYELGYSAASIASFFRERSYAPGKLQQFFRRLREAPGGPRKRRIWTTTDYQTVETYYFAYGWEVMEIINHFPERGYEEHALRQFIRRVREARGKGKQVHERSPKRPTFPETTPGNG